MNGWYLLLWKKLMNHQMYVAVHYDNLDDALNRIFDEGQIDKSKYQKVMQEMKQMFSSHPDAAKIISQAGGESIPAWILISSDALDPTLAAIKKQNIKITVAP